MFGDIYSTLLQEISSALGDVLRLEPDENNSCVIVFPGDLRVQLEPDSQQNSLLILTELGELAAGKYREEVLYEGLRANDQRPPRYGNFAYHPKRNQLVLWERLPLKNLRGQEVASFLGFFVIKALECQKAISSNMLPAIPMAPTPKMTSPMGLFGNR